MGKRTKTSSIRNRLIEAAGELFAEKGYEETTIRDICRQADTNIAAVNYHFKGKDHLFEEVIIDVIRTGWRKYPVGYGFPDAGTPEERLRAFVRSFFLRRFDFDRPAWHGRLLRRETLMMTPRACRLVGKHIVRNDELLASAVWDLLGREAGDELVRRCSASVKGQMLIFMHPRPDMKRPLAVPPKTPEEVEEIVRHITEFSLAGLEKVKKGLPSLNNRKRNAR
jgi:AcrR family transcriptional regulator